MKMLGRHLWLLGMLLSTLSATAQIGKEFREVRMKGPVVQAHSSTTFMTVKEDGEQKVIMSQAQVAQVENGKVVREEMDNDFSSVTGTNITEVEWEDDRLLRVREFSRRGNGRQRLDKQFIPIYNKAGQIVTENILFGEEELRATLHYEYSTSAAGNEVLEMTMYKPDEVEPQGHFYIESDEWGEVLHIESVGQDTGIYTRRLRAEGDSLFISENIVASRQRRGEKDTFTLITLNRYDEYGNMTYSKIINRKLHGTFEGDKEMHIITEVNYLYEGDPIPGKDAAASNFAGSWYNKVYNLALLLIPSDTSPLNGTYQAAAFNDKDPELVEAGTEWLFKLRDSQMGAWDYNEATELITFKQNGEIVAQVKAQLSMFQLKLEGDKQFRATVRLQRELN